MYFISTKKHKNVLISPLARPEDVPQEVDVYAVARDATTGDFLPGVSVELDGDEGSYSGVTGVNGRVDLGPLLEGSEAELTATA